MTTYTVVAALEFGNSYSGYAFSNKSEFETNPPNIRINKPWMCVNREFLGKRTSTCILLKSKTEVQCIGYEAESEYASYNEDEQKRRYFFRNFQQHLFYKDFCRLARCPEVRGNHLSFKRVVSAFIKSLVIKCRMQIRESYENIKDEEIRWLITIPEYLTPAAEQFMKECVKKAKIPHGQFTLVTETEAAFAYCQKLLKSDQYSKLEDSAEYLIVDLGVHEADIRVVKNVNGDIIEKYRKPTTGERYSVHTHFLDFLGRAIGFDVTGILMEDTFVYLDIERGFEEFKLSAIGKTNIIVKLPRTIEDKLSKYQPNDMMKWKIEEHKLVFLKDTVKKILKNEIDDVINQLEMVFQSYRDAHTISYIVMKGDFYICCSVKHTMEIKFPQKCIIFSAFNEEAVMKGAVLSEWQQKYELLPVYDKPIHKKGYVLVINFLFPEDENYKRTGSLDDVEKLKTFFKEPEYEVVCWEDMKKTDLTSALNALRNEVLANNADQYHSFICVIMSHGDQQGINTTDNVITVDELIAPFKNNVAERFKGKPKLFLIQACRGGKEQALNEYANRKLANDYSAVLRMPTDADTIIIYATTPGYVSKRITKSPTWTGAWFIHAFLSVAEKYRKNHLLEILTAVNFELAKNPEYVFGRGKKCQISMSEISLSKLFYL